MRIELSIVIPVYNVEAYVGKCLASVFDTTASSEDFEVIVVNDGTKDGSMEVVRQFADRPNLTIIEQENQGLSVARMKGSSVAKGEYVWFIDSDDWVVEDGVGKVLALLNERPESEVLLFPLELISDEKSCGQLDFRIESDRQATARDIVSGLGMHVAGVMHFVFRRSFLSDPWLFFPEGRIHEDYYFSPVLMRLAGKVDLIKDPVYRYRMNRQESIMSALTVRSAYDLVANHKLLMRFKRQTLDSVEWPWFDEYCFYHLAFSYSRLSSLFGTREFKGFIRSHGLYVWQEWNRALPDVSWKRIVRRLVFCEMPRFYLSIFGVCPS